MTDPHDPRPAEKPSIRDTPISPGPGPWPWLGLTVTLMGTLMGTLMVGEW